MLCQYAGPQQFIKRRLLLYLAPARGTTPQVLGESTGAGRVKFSRKIERGKGRYVVAVHEASLVEN
jgi:hypothetical protein